MLLFKGNGAGICRAERLEASVGLAPLVAATHKLAQLSELNLHISFRKVFAI